MRNSVGERPPAEKAAAPIETIDPRRRWSGTDLVLFGGFFVFAVMFGPAIMVGIIRAFVPDFGFADLTAIHQVAFQAIVDGVLLLFILFLVRGVHGFSFREEMGWNREHGYGVFPLILTGAGLAVSVLIVASLFPPAEPPPIESMLSTPGAIGIFAIFGIGMAPIFEELIFRGFLFRVLDRLAGPAVAVPLTAVLFASLHVPQLWGSWAGILLIFGVGYVLSALRHHAGSIIPPIIVHTAYNGMLFFAFALSTLVQESGVAGWVS